MNVAITKDEWWPVYAIDEDPEGDFEVDDEFVTRYKAAFKLFNEVQAELRGMYKAKYSGG